ncbi:uncharacterized protein LOC131006698 [Salvia miltiorrhiza]|uniref:uncharacterized protein LOC131006698 n=1 Tax=Salvia miltiorrhiza TaxID=226208 RepID=UPI0025ABAFAF|nr:uncharacterized protein LOC131006698 [Salvia miltiorrhiza]
MGPMRRVSTEFRRDKAKSNTLRRAGTSGILAKKLRLSTDLNDAVMEEQFRGLGSSAKKRDVRHVIGQQRVDLCFIQETKMESMEGEMCNGWWGRNNYGLARRDAEGRSGGILCAWNKDHFTATSSWDMQGAVIINGVGKAGNLSYCLINVYASNVAREKAESWDKLQILAEQNRDRCLCIMGDFNAIRERGERVGKSENFDTADMRRFDAFIRDSELTEVRTQGRKFTWYQANGRCKSKLDRFLVNNCWLDSWPSTVERCLQRSVSDHCPILLSTKIVDWGPKPFRFINAWTTHPEFNQLIQKEKLKALKVALKEWNKSTFGLIDNEIKRGKEELQQWDAIDDVFGLEQEVIKRNEVRAKIILHTRNKNWLLGQKAKSRWLNEGYINSHFFHKVIAGQMRKNKIAGMWFEEQWIDEPGALNAKVSEFFGNFFRRKDRILPIIPPDFAARRLSTEDKLWLVRPFTEDELKDAV